MRIVIWQMLIQSTQILKYSSLEYFGHEYYSSILPLVGRVHLASCLTDKGE